MAKGDVDTNLVPWSTNTAKHSAAFKLFHYPFQCLTSGLHLITAQELETFGHLTTGDAVTDRVLASEERLVTFTVVEMVRVHSEGGGVRLVNPADGAKIYEMIYQHMQDWRAEVEANPTCRTAPIEDLRAMDEFARELYPHARFYMNFNPANTVLFSRLDTIFTNRHGFARAGMSRGVAMPESAAVPQHVSHIDPMSKLLRERERYFRNQ
jgi:hypothetical protein